MFAVYVYRNYYRNNRNAGGYITVIEEDLEYPRGLLGSIMDDSLSDSVFETSETESDSPIQTNYEPVPSTALSISSDTVENPEGAYQTTKL